MPAMTPGLGCATIVCSASFERGAGAVLTLSSRAGVIAPPAISVPPLPLMRPTARLASIARLTNRPRNIRSGQGLTDFAQARHWGLSRESACVANQVACLCRLAVAPLPI